MRVFALLCGAVVAESAAFAQTPGRVQVEVTEELRAKPDACRLDFRIEFRNPDPSVATTEVADELKKVKEAFAKLKIEGATLTPLPLVVTRQEQQVRNPRGAVLPGEIDYRVSRPLWVVVEGEDLDKLTTKLTKVQTELYALGVKNQVDGVEPRPAYSTKAGWDEPAQAVLESAAKRARMKAERLATAAGEKLGNLVSTEHISYNTQYNPAAGVYDQFTVDGDGEMVLRLRVRVVYEMKK